MLLRLLRIVVVALGLFFLFRFSLEIGLARGRQPLPGFSWALGVLTFLFLVRAIVTERSRGPEDNWQKDILWGLTAGSVITILSRF
jgi:hypothetical protein